jgi:hypothetical protein
VSQGRFAGFHFVLAEGRQPPVDNRLAGFFLEEALSPGGHIWDVPDEQIDEMNRW